jgi:heptosyltransferase-2
MRRNLPNAWITLVVKPETVNLVERCPYVNEVLSFNLQVAKRMRRYRLLWRAIRLVKQRILPRNFDLAILPRWDEDLYYGTFLTYLSGAPWRVGYSEKVISHKQIHNQGFDRLLTEVLVSTDIKHEVLHNLDIIRNLGLMVYKLGLELWVSPADEKFAFKKLYPHNVLNFNELIIAMSPGVSHPKRQWPLKRFIDLSIWLRKKYQTRILVLGGPGDDLLGRTMSDALGACLVNLVGQTTLRQAGALLKHCHLFVGNDSGPMHLAAAAGIPVVEISAHPSNGSAQHSNSPHRFGPWGVPHRVLQPPIATSPCSDSCAAKIPHCILSVTVEQVQSAVEELLSIRLNG